MSEQAHIDADLIVEFLDDLRKANVETDFCPRCLSMALFLCGIKEALSVETPQGVAEVLRELAERVGTMQQAARH